MRNWSWDELKHLCYQWINHNNIKANICEVVLIWRVNEERKEKKEEAKGHMASISSQEKVGLFDFQGQSSLVWTILSPTIFPFLYFSKNKTPSSVIEGDKKLSPTLPNENFVKRKKRKRGDDHSSQLLLFSNQPNRKTTAAGKKTEHRYNRIRTYKHNQHRVIIKKIKIEIPPGFRRKWKKKNMIFT